MKLLEISRALNGILKGPDDIEISGPAKIEDAIAGQITFLANPKYKSHVANTKASAIVIDQEIPDLNLPAIKVKNAYLGFLQLLKLFKPPRNENFIGISAKAEIAKDAIIAESCSIAPFSYVGSKSKIGKKTIIYPGVSIYNNVQIGDNCIIYANVSIREDCKVGNNVILQDGAIIGSDGFGFAPQNGTYEKIPQIGNVVIEDNVEIGANTTIDRATVGSTVIKKGVKLDNLIQIGHNCIVDEDTVIAAQSGVAGSTKIGKHVTIGGQVGVNGHISIADNTVVAGQSGVTKNTSENSILMGNPAMPIMKKKRIDVCTKQLPESIKKLHLLESDITELKKRLKD